MVGPKKYHFVYQTTNIINGKSYIGVHSTSNLNDGYLGCGFYRGYNVSKHKGKRGLKGAIAKYGVDNFYMSPIEFFNTPEEAYKEEKRLVNKYWVMSDSNYNLATGGVYSGKSPMTKEQRKMLIELHSKSFVVVNILTSDTYYVKNLLEWARLYFPEELYIPNTNKHNNKNKGTCNLYSVASGKTRLVNNKWWACHISDWKGKPIIKPRKKPKVRKGYVKDVSSLKYTNITLINPKGKKVIVSNLYQFANSQGLDYSSLVKLINGKISHLRYWTINLLNHHKVVSYFLKEGKLVRITSIKRYCKEIGMCPKGLYKLKSGKILKYKDYERV